MSSADLPDDELRRLDRLANRCIRYLVLVALASFLVGAYLLAQSQLFSQLLLGFCGSAVAALTSCLDRYAAGFEREDGKPFPTNAKTGEGKFSRRFARWLFVRPFLGAIVAPAFIWGLAHFTKDPGPFLTQPESLGFSDFTAGLLAKSVVDLIKNLFKNVFKG